jgi:protein-disulfide isomerase
MPKVTTKTKAARIKKTAAKSSVKPLLKSAPAKSAPKKAETREIAIDVEKLFQPIATLLGSIIIAASILISAGGGGLVAKTTAVATATPTTTAATTTGTVTVDLDTIKNLYKGDYMKFGDENRKVLFVEVADPSCPYCHIAAGKNPELNKSAGSFTLVQDGGTYIAPVPEMKKLLDEGQASYVYIYSPGHGNGELGIRALYCGYEMGKFWEVHDLLMSAAGYTLQNETVKNDMSKASQVADFLKPAVDSNAMLSCMTSGKYDSRLKSEPAIATSLGVNGTPGFFVNTTNFAGAYSWDDMKSVVEAALK